MRASFLLFVLVACSEASNGRAPIVVPLPDASTPGVDAGAPPKDAKATVDVTVVDAAASSVVVNEISGKGTEWVELYNSGPGAIDLSGFSVADLDKTTSGPKMDEATKLPPGTVLSPNAYVLVVALAKDASAPECPDAGQSYCFGAVWGISNKDGDALFLVSPDGAVVSKGDYPANVVGTGQTWCRLPNGKGELEACAPTPGARNER
jgi:hypothetical protein